MNTVSEVFGHPLPSPNKEVFMGLELEVEGWDEFARVPDRFLDTWNIIPDHSLRNNGIEFVHKAPLRGEELSVSVDALSEVLSTFSNLSLSHRCSLHCHIDCRDMTVVQIESLYRIYTMLEPALYYVGVKDRYDNIYCPGLSHATEQVKQSGVCFASRDMHRFIRHGCKYTGFNFLPLAEQGSVEIRTHSGTLNGQDVVNWVDILQGITTFAKTQTLDDVKFLSTLLPDEVIDIVFHGYERAGNLLRCPALYDYWENAKLNILYLDLIDEMLLEYVDPPPEGVEEVDTEYLSTMIMENAAALGG